MPEQTLARVGGPSDSSALVPQRAASVVPTLEPSALAKFVALREWLFNQIAKKLAEDGVCKHYEGAFAIHLPNYFNARTPGEPHLSDIQRAWRIELHCYVFGPSRHYEWTAPTFAECVDKADAEIRSWEHDD